MKASDFDFHLPESSIARRPAVPRDSSRLLVLHRDGSIEHRSFSHLPEYLNGGDLLLLNNTKVFPARLTGAKKTGGKIEMLLVREIKSGIWEVLSRGRYTGTVYISEELSGDMFDGNSITFKSINASGNRGYSSDLMKTLWKVGLMPLPPYIKREPDDKDKESYQTVYADKVGSIAAPTAGLHFTDELIAGLEKKGIIIKFLTLHVGVGTFKPIRVENLRDHTMDAEHFEIEMPLMETIKAVKARKRRVISVGTTTTRAIEGFVGSRWSENNPPPSPLRLTPPPPAPPLKIRGGRGSYDSQGDEKGVIKGTTDIFIYPGYPFRVVDSLVTNFHLPGSSPLMLASAFGGVKNLMNAYKCAVSEGYRFFSYGDAMLIL